MEQYVNTLTLRIRINSLYHLIICAVTCISAIIFTIYFPHWPLVVTLAVTSSITLISGITGYKIDANSRKSKVLRHFVIEIILLAAWDFGGVVCVITIIIGTIKNVDTIEEVIIIIACCLIYIGAFIFFWRTFLVVNKLVTSLNKRRYSQNRGFSSGRALLETTFVSKEESISMNQRLSPNVTSNPKQVSINTSSLTT
ncbi:hypothetical protein SteCoe_12284 [Stentor coeruleus]|uniref:Uncharacterized protein n=1 Tax=Stentor coeruleus TaxID=5963 RepID=A0A1R2CB42_9CILI|nr:hypothetical protein SteCoe_12284 [Stentor coeruleus]